MAQVEIKIILNTKEGVKNIDFFTSVDGVFLNEDDVVDKIGNIIEKKVLQNNIVAESGYAVALHENEELFTMTFMKTNLGEMEQWVKMKEMTNQTIH
tara:strand:+ start:774 stop:1064 length:291 start_codon:yes stop_codon:yes gene_type:complete